MSKSVRKQEYRQFTSLYEYIKKLGNIFFRWRSYIPVTLFLVLILRLNDLKHTFSNQKIEIIYQAFCLFISSLGEIVRIITVGFAPSGTSGRNTKTQIAATLNTSGLYSITRNPLYFGNFLIILGLSLFTRSYLIVILNCLLFLIFYVPIILVEECFLLSRFGNTYKEYLSETPCFFPRLHLWRPPANDWSWNRVIRREYSSILSVILSFAIIATIRLYVIHNKAVINKYWLIAVGLALAVWVIIRIMRLLKKI